MKFVPKELDETADVSRGKRTVESWLGAAIKTAVGLLAAYIVIGLLADVIVYNISSETEANWFAEFGRVVGARRPKDDADFERAKRILEKLKSSADLRPLPYELALIDLAAPNAVAVPGGCIGVTRSLLQEVETEKGLAMVLAHEFGHHQHRHCLERLGRALLFGLALNFVVGDSNWIIESAVAVAEAGWSRDQEREADEFGLRLVHQAYGDTEGCLEFFKLVREKYDERHAIFVGFFATHPLTEERLETLRELQRELNR